MKIECACGTTLPLPLHEDQQTVCSCGRAYFLRYNAAALLERIDRLQREIDALRTKQ